MVLRPWKFSPHAFFSRRKKTATIQQCGLEQSSVNDQFSAATINTKVGKEKLKDKFRFRRWRPNKRKRKQFLAQQQEIAISYGTDGSSSGIHYGSSSFECDDSSNAFESRRVSSTAENDQSLSNTDYDNSMSATSDNDCSLSASLSLYNHLEVNPLDMYLQSRHERAMVRLCALLWILKLDEDRAQRHSETGSSWDDEEELRSYQLPVDQPQLQPCARRQEFEMERDSSICMSPRIIAKHQLYDKINTRSTSPARRPSSDAVHRASEVLRVLQANTSGANSSEVAELRKLLTSPNMK
ncbi:peripheral plasma membrane protein CASK isoform X2, partial [Biomphalaria glabrata]